MSTATKPAPKKKSTNIKLQPLGDRLVLQREESEERTAGGIVLPDTAKDKPARGTVVAVGEGKLLENGRRGQLQVKVGDQLRLVKKKESNVVPIPVAAVVKRDGADVVFVLSDGRAKLRKVTVVDRTATEALIGSGLAAGDSVITSSADTLQEDQPAATQ